MTLLTATADVSLKVRDALRTRVGICTIQWVEMTEKLEEGKGTTGDRLHGRAVFHFAVSMFLLAAFALSLMAAAWGGVKPPLRLSAVAQGVGNATGSAAGTGPGTGAGLALRPPVAGSGLGETLEAIEGARVVTRILYVTAHPDDESSSILTYLARGLHADVALLSLTRGEGGQNALGPEQAPQLGVIRTAELLRATQQYGVRLYFTRAADFGYSKTAEETLRIWGDAVVDDMVAVLLHFRPHIIINNWGGVRGGHGQHQAAGLLVPRALEEAARRDAARLSGNQSDSRFQIPDSRLAPDSSAARDSRSAPDSRTSHDMRRGAKETEAIQSQAKNSSRYAKNLKTEAKQSQARNSSRDAKNLNVSSTESHSGNQGDSRFKIPDSRPGRNTEWPWAETVVFNLSRGGAPGNAIALPTDEISPLWGKSYNEIGLEGFVNHRTQGIVGFRGSRFFRGRRTLVPAQAQLMSSVPIRAAKDAAIEKAIDAAERLDWPEAARQLAQSGKLRQNFAAWLKEAGLSDEPGLQSRLTARLERALALVAGLRLEATANRSELVAGEKFTVTVAWQRRHVVPLEMGEPELVLPEGWQVTEKAADERGPELSGRGGAQFTVQVPADAKKPEVGNEWMYPWPPALVRARVTAKLYGYEFAVEEDVTAQRVTTTRVDDLPLTLAPAVTLTPEPRQFVVAQNQPQKPLELVARVRHYGSAPAEVTVALEAPTAWRASQAVRLQFDGAGDQLVKFTVTPTGRGAPAVGSFPLKLVARVGRGGEFRTSLEPLVTLPTRLWSEPAVANVRVFDVNVPRGLRVGYVAADNDPIPASLRQLGIEVTMLDEAALAFGDLGSFDAIAIGIRAYELREDLIRANRRLLDYCAAGGTLVVQYQRDSVWRRWNPAPYPATVADPTLRVSVEDAPVRLLAPEHALLNVPNRISAGDFEGWVQERGLYFWGEFDARYTPLLSMNDPGEKETTGSLVVAQHGRGLYIYTGLSFFRQLPEGVPGAYRLFVNLLSQ